MVANHVHLLLSIYFISTQYIFCNAIQNCPNCPAQWKNSILGIINRATYNEPRNVHFSFYSDWIDELTKPDVAVHVEYVDANKIKDFKPVSTRSIAQESYEIIYLFHATAEAAAIPGQASTSATDSDIHIEQEHTEHTEHAVVSPVSPLATDIDMFLTLNPCWMPLLEPCVFNCSRHLKGTFQSRTIPNYGNSVVLLRLPSKGFYDTCVLFEHLTKRQFPEKCIYDSDHMISFALHNIGWSHTLHTMIHTMENILMNKHSHKVFVVPYAEKFLGKYQSFKLDNGSVVERENSGWYWANEATCPRDTYLFDPWACNFLPISNCSNRGSVFDIPADTTDREYGLDYTFVQDKILGITRQTRRLSEDAPLSDDVYWIDQRLISLVSRPHARLRQMIRKSLRLVRPLEEAIERSPRVPRYDANNAHTATTTAAALDNTMGTVATATTAAAATTTTTASTTTAATTTATTAASTTTTTTTGGVIAPHRYHQRSQHFNRYSRSSSVLRLPGPPCIAMHVRHGDSIYDARNNNNTDRSIHAHIENVRPLAEKLGTNVIFLMTDNATLYSYVTYRYPEYNWVMQHRPMKSTIRMFDVLNEPDIQLELAHVFADISYGGSCVALVACFDSGMAAQVRKC
jgi:hypothetical protein